MSRPSVEKLSLIYTHQALERGMRLRDAGNDPEDKEVVVNGDCRAYPVSAGTLRRCGERPPPCGSQSGLYFTVALERATSTCILSVSFLAYGNPLIRDVRVSVRSLRTSRVTTRPGKVFPIGVHLYFGTPALGFIIPFKPGASPFD